MTRHAALPGQRRPALADALGRALVFGLGSLSILSLLVYFFGIASFEQSARWLSLLECAGLIAVLAWAQTSRRTDVRRRIVSGLWAGGLATLAYDLVRVPVSYAGIPVFKAISYFGTILLALEIPSPLSETVGWIYHLSNGISFGLMYAAVVRTPRLITGVAWGCSLEVLMLLTPYAEVFGYRLSSAYLAITLGAHVAYGVVLWMALRGWGTLSSSVLTACALSVPLGISAIAADFHGRHSEHLPQSPPAYLGRHLYTTWNVPEPDRLAALWVLQRFVDREARFHFISPFSPLRHGRAFDLPEAEIRRQATRSATEVLLAAHGLSSDGRLERLAAMTHLAEVTPWLVPTDSEPTRLARSLREVADSSCGRALANPCLPRLFTFLDDWYAIRSVTE